MPRVSSGNYKCSNFANKGGKNIKGYNYTRRRRLFKFEDSVLDHLEMKHNSSKAHDVQLFRVNVKENSHARKDAINHQEGDLFKDDHEFERFINGVLEAEAERVLKENYNLRDHQQQHEEWFIRKSDKEFYRYISS
ncbi:hypothetical protein HAX54_040019 [Datura stramonium]|uniref:Uncharacterized protein n=1 Tax=Datura stramonium TaxID=4076 RepID=A0ABS8RNV9_DATST|nr:hypothetical protein [Datura stramonium]